MLNRQQRRQLPDKPTAERLRDQEIIKLLNRINNYYEILKITEDSKTIKQIKRRIQERIDATQKYLTELSKESSKK